MPKQIAAVKKRRVRGSTSGRPIMALLDLLGRRWSLRILWELREQAADLAGPAHGLRRGLAHRAAGPAVGAARRRGFVELVPGDGYRLTALGRELLENFLPLHRFAERWSKRSLRD